MTKVAVVFHSRFGHTAKQALAVYEGVASVAETEARLIVAADADKQWDFLAAADAIIFGCPTYMGSASAEFKKFMEASSKVWRDMGWRNKVAAGFTNSGSQHGDKLSTLMQLALYAMQHGMVWVGVDLMPGNNSTQGSVSDLNRHGAWLGAMAQSNVDQGADVQPGQADLDTARHLGKRVAEIASQFVRGRV